MWTSTKFKIAHSITNCQKHLHWHKRAPLFNLPSGLSQNGITQNNQSMCKLFSTHIPLRVSNSNKLGQRLYARNNKPVVENSKYLPNRQFVRNLERNYDPLASRYQSRRRKQQQQEEAVNKDTLLYTYEDQTRYKSIVACGFTIAFVLFGEGALVLYDSDPNRDKIPLSEDATRVERFKAWGRRYKFYFLGTAYFIIGVTMCYLMPMYVGRSVKELWLLEGGRDLKILTYSVFGPRKELVVPIIETDFLSPRHVKGNNISFSVKGKRLFYMLDKTNGTFHNSTLFDREICIARDLKK